MRDEEYYYEVDAENRVRSVSATWCRFANDNGADTIADPEAVAGRSLWSFISGREVRHIYGLIFDRVRRKERRSSVPFRCDSPTRKRYMELTIEPLADRGLALTGRLLREEEREYMPLLDAATDRSDELIPICSWCKRVEIEGEGWFEVEDAVRLLYLFKAPTLPQLTHTVCGECEVAAEGRDDEPTA